MQREARRLPTAGRGALWLAGFPHPTEAGRELVVLLRASASPSPPPAARPETRMVQIEARLLALLPGAVRRVFGDDVPGAEDPVRHLDAHGVLAAVIYVCRRWPLPERLAKTTWITRLREQPRGVELPYGVAITLAGLCVLPSTAWMADTVWRI